MPKRTARTVFAEGQAAPTVIEAVEEKFSERSYRLLRRDVLIYSAQIVTEALIARALGPVAMGVWVILRLIPVYAEVFGRSQVDTAAIYVLGTREYGIGRVAFAVTLISLASALLVVAAFLLVQDWLFATFLRQAADYRLAVAAVLAYVPFRFLVICYNKLLIYEEDIRGYNTANALMTLVPAVLGAVLVLVFHRGITGLAVALIVGGAAAIAYSAGRLHARHPLVAHCDARIMGDLLTFGLKTYVWMMVTFLHTYASATLVVLYLPATQVAFFRMAQDRASLLSKIPGGVASLLYPRVARGRDAAEARALAVRSIRLTLLVLLAGGAAAVFVAYPAVYVLYGPAFLGVAAPLVILVPGFVADASSSLLLQYYTGLGKLRIVVGLASAGVAIQVVLLLAGLRYGGVAGAAAAVTVAYCIVAAARFAAFFKTDGVSPAELLLIRREDIRFVVEFLRRRLRRPLGARVLPGGGDIAATAQE